VQSGVIDILSYLLSFPGQVGILLILLVLLFFIFSKRKQMKRETRKLLIIMASIAATAILFSTLFMAWLAFMINNNPPPNPPPPQMPPSTVVTVETSSPSSLPTQEPPKVLREDILNYPEIMEINANINFEIKLGDELTDDEFESKGYTLRQPVYGGFLEYTDDNNKTSVIMGGFPDILDSSCVRTFETTNKEH